MQNKKAEYAVHAAIWAVMFIWPLMFMNQGKGISNVQLVFMSMAQVTLMVEFYVNYLWLTPKYFIGGKKRLFWLYNLLMILVLGIGLHYWMDTTRAFFEKGPQGPPPPYVFNVLFTLRDMFNLAISAAIAVTVRLSLQWIDTENALQKAEAARAQAELKNLRSQINPHFLLNTLNNIYALTALDTKRAQDAIQQLSKLLRHILYDNEQPYVNLCDEVQFLNNYINLMKIRISASVDVKLNVSLPEPCNIEIAPLIFISLVENAFKHGVSPTQHSFIHVNITADDEKIVCHIENSNFPKAASDHSGHGIGLQQVAKRLELTYKDKYEWIQGTNQNKTIYSSKITIYDTKLCNH